MRLQRTFARVPDQLSIYLWTQETLILSTAPSASGEVLLIQGLSQLCMRCTDSQHQLHLYHA